MHSGPRVLQSTTRSATGGCGSRCFVPVRPSTLPVILAQTFSTHWSPRRSSRRVNEQSLVLSVTHGEHRFLFTGDIEEEAEAALAPRVGKATVVKVAHHGSASSSSSALIAAADPDWAVISCGQDNRFRHPRDEVLGRWHGAAIARTDRDGTVEFSSNGTALTVRAWRAGEGWRGLDGRQMMSAPPGDLHSDNQVVEP